MTRRLLAVMLLAVSLHAQEQPDPPEPKPENHFNRRAFVAGVSLLAASKTADVITTRQPLDRGGVELNPIFDRYPLRAKSAGINAGSSLLNPSRSI